jgi:hypothetical protein
MGETKESNVRERIPIEGDDPEPKPTRHCVYCKRKLKAEEPAMCKDCAEKFR